MSQPTTARFVGVTTTPSEVVADLLFVPVFGATDHLEELADIDRAVAGTLSRAKASGEYRVKQHEMLMAPVAPNTWKSGRVVFVGAGPRNAIDAERTRRIAAACGYQARRRAAASAAFLTRGLSAATIADGLSAAEFDGGTYKNDREPARHFPPEMQVVVPGGDRAAVERDVAAGRTIGESANFARSLANEPGNVLTPREFAARVQAMAETVGLDVEILDEHRIRALEMNLLLSVAQGSAEPPRVIVLRHDPPGAPATPVLGFVGKGVTFDSGGISIKPADGMERMKDDMAGGAAVAGALRALKLLGGTHRVIGVIPTTENMPGGRATRPGDVITGASGTTVEIINTDAEGRLILGDALWYAREQGATHLVDIATLTGACIVALGRHVSGLFGAPDSWVDTIRASAANAGDRVWPLPIYEETADELRSEIADIVNSAGRPGGAITAAAFLQRFAANVPWAHLDIAGTAWSEAKHPYQPKGATGVAIRTLIELGMTGGRSSPK